MAVSRFDVTLKEARVFGGTTVNCFVHLDVVKPVMVKKVYVTFAGNCNVVVPQGRAVVQDKESYFNVNVPAGDFNCVVEPGSYTYPVVFELPPHIPSTFKGEYGKIRYTAKAKIEAEGIRGLDMEREFEVKAVLNTFKHREDMRPQDTQKDSETYTACLDNRSLSISLRTKRGDYEPGHHIKFKSVIDNLTKSTMYGSKVVLRQTTTYKSLEGDFSVRTDPVDLCEVKRGTIPSKGGDMYKWESLEIPNDVPTILHSKLIELRYFLVAIVYKSPGKEYIVLPLELFFSHGYYTPAGLDNYVVFFNDPEDDEEDDPHDFFGGGAGTIGGKRASIASQYLPRLQNVHEFVVQPVPPVCSLVMVLYCFTILTNPILGVVTVMLYSQVGSMIKHGRIDAAIKRISLCKYLAIVNVLVTVLALIITRFVYGEVFNTITAK